MLVRTRLHLLACVPSIRTACAARQVTSSTTATAATCSSTRMCFHGARPLETGDQRSASNTYEARRVFADRRCAFTLPLLGLMLNVLRELLVSRRFSFDVASSRFMILAAGSLLWSFMLVPCRRPARRRGALQCIPKLYSRLSGQRTQLCPRIRAMVGALSAPA